jgi:hypothetical protein
MPVFHLTTFASEATLAIVNGYWVPVLFALVCALVGCILHTLGRA